MGSSLRLLDRTGVPIGGLYPADPGSPDSTNRSLVVRASDSVHGIADALRASGSFRTLASFCRGRRYSAFGLRTRGTSRERAELIQSGISPIRLAHVEQFDKALFTGTVAHETAPVDDVALSDAFKSVRTTDTFYRATLGRHGFAGSGFPWRMTVVDDFESAAWFLPRRAVVAGARNAWVQDVVGHESGHAVFDSVLSDVAEAPQTSALQEHFADVFGSASDQFARFETTTDASWSIAARIGMQLDSPLDPDAYARSMSDPSDALFEPQPEHMRDFSITERDKGGAHTNVGIPNRAYVMAAKRLGGYAWQHVTRIWYVALRDHLRSDATFADAARATVIAAHELHGAESPELQAVVGAWRDAGVDWTQGRTNFAPGSGPRADW